jgi:hypothetical protein
MTLPNFIIDDICYNYGDQICNLGYACDACPYNFPRDITELEIIERLQIGL